MNCHQKAEMNFWIFACARSFSSGPSTSPMLSWYSYNSQHMHIYSSVFLLFTTHYLIHIPITDHHRRTCHSSLINKWLKFRFLFHMTSFNFWNIRIQTKWLLYHTSSIMPHKWCLEPIKGKKINEWVTIEVTIQRIIVT